MGKHGRARGVALGLPHLWHLVQAGEQRIGLQGESHSRVSHRAGCFAVKVAGLDVRSDNHGFVGDSRDSTCKLWWIVRRGLSEKNLFHSPTTRSASAMAAIAIDGSSSCCHWWDEQNEEAQDLPFPLRSFAAGFQWHVHQSNSGHRDHDNPAGQGLVVFVWQTRPTRGCAVIRQHF